METGYSQLELEARALRYGVDKYRYYLEGIEKVTCFVDAKALLPFFNHENREAPPRIQRQVLAVQDIPLVLVHIEGKKNPSDFLSRERNVENDATAADLNDMEISDALENHLVKAITEREDQSPMALARIKKLTLKDQCYNSSSKEFWKMILTNIEKIHKSNHIMECATNCQSLTTWLSVAQEELCYQKSCMHEQ